MTLTITQQKSQSHLAVAIDDARTGKYTGKHYTPEQFAVAAGCSTSTLYRWLRSQRIPRSLSHIDRLVKLGVPRYLFRPAQETVRQGRPRLAS